MTFKGGKRIIETGGCQFSQTYVMIAGFSSSTEFPLTISSNRAGMFGFYPADDSSLYAKSSAGDTDFGVQISTIDSTDIQFSFVHVGIRDYTASYP